MQACNAMHRRFVFRLAILVVLATPCARAQQSLPNAAACPSTTTSTTLPLCAGPISPPPAKHTQNHKKTPPKQPAPPNVGPTNNEKPPEKPSLTLALEPNRVLITPPSISGAGTIFVTFAHVMPNRITLRIKPPDDDRDHPIIGFKQNESLDSINLDKVQCQAAQPCAIPYNITEIWPSGKQTSTIEALIDGQVVQTAGIVALRQKLPPPPVISGDAIKDNNRILFDATKAGSFWLKISNPDSGRPYDLAFSIADLTPNLCPSDAPIVLTPAVAHLEPNGSSSVLVRVSPCITESVTGILQVTDLDKPHRIMVGMPFDIENKVRPMVAIAAWVFAGAFISILLNNFFPLERSKQKLRESLSRTEAAIKSCTDLHGGVIDALQARLSALRYSLRSISAVKPDKNELVRDVQQAAAALDTAAAIARQIDQEYGRVAGSLSQLSIASFVDISRCLRVAEDVLISSDNAAATSATKSARDRLSAVLADTDQIALRATIGDRITSLQREINDVAVGRQAAERAQAWRPSLQEKLLKIGNLHVDDLKAKKTDELLRDEADIFIIETWLHDIAPRLPTTEAKFNTFVNDILEALEKVPKSTRTHVMIELIRADTTPYDIYNSLSKKDGQTKQGGEIDCEPKPFYYVATPITFRFKDPLISQLPAARAFPTYTWEFDDDKSLKNVDFYQRIHFFKPSAMYGTKRIFYFFTEAIHQFRHGTPARHWRTASVRVDVVVPGHEAIQFPLDVNPRAADGSLISWMDLFGFAISTSIAVVVAFGAKYGASVSDLPSHLAFSDALTAFMFGFGLDQLRDTVSNQATTRLAPTTPAAPQTS